MGSVKVFSLDAGPLNFAKPFPVPPELDAIGVVAESVVNAPVLGVTAPIVVLLIVALTMGTAPTHEVPSQLHE